MAADTTVQGWIEDLEEIVRNIEATKIYAANILAGDLLVRMKGSLGGSIENIDVK